MVYLLIKGPSYRGLDFDAREKVREGLRKQLVTHGIRFVEYGWVWDEEDRCLLVVGQYAHPDDASLWSKEHGCQALVAKKLGFIFLLTKDEEESIFHSTDKLSYFLDVKRSLIYALSAGSRG